MKLLRFCSGNVGFARMWKAPSFMGHSVIILRLNKWSHHEDVAVDSQDQKPVALCPLTFPHIPTLFDQLLRP